MSNHSLISFFQRHVVKLLEPALQSTPKSQYSALNLCPASFDSGLEKLLNGMLGATYRPRKLAFDTVPSDWIHAPRS